MRKSFAAAVIAGSALTAACGQSHAGDGPSVSRSYPVGTFQQIEVAGPYDVTVQTGGNPSVSAQGSQSTLDRTEVTVEGGKLMIRPKGHGLFSFSFGSHHKTTFTVTVPQLTSATLAGAGDLNVNAVHGDTFEAALAGAGDLGIGSVDVKSLKVSMTGAGDAKVGAGKAEIAEYSAVGAGGIDARGVVTRDAKITIAGSGDVHANATGAAVVDVMGSGDVDVTGGAKCAVTKHGSGDVRCS